MHADVFPVSIPSEDPVITKMMGSLASHATAWGQESEAKQACFDMKKVSEKMSGNHSDKSSCLLGTKIIIYKESDSLPHLLLHSVFKTSPSAEQFYLRQTITIILPFFHER